MFCHNITEQRIMVAMVIFIVTCLLFAMSLKQRSYNIFLVECDMEVKQHRVYVNQDKIIGLMVRLLLPW